MSSCLQKTYFRAFDSLRKNRFQIVHVNSNGKSHMANVSNGVSQGSVLGPLLYNIFTSDVISFFQILNDVFFISYANEIVYERVMEWC